MNVDAASNKSNRTRLGVIRTLIIVGLLFGLGSQFIMAGIRVGDPAPEIMGLTSTGKELRLSDFRGKSVVVLYFYPKDETSICTAQACSFRDAYEDFTKAGAVVIGVSHDSAESHRDFANSHKLPFELLSDADGSLRKAFSVPRTFGLIPGRVTYVIDRSGIVRMVFNGQFTADGHVTRALKMVRELAAQSPE